MLNFTGTNAVCECAKCAVCGSVRVTANHGHTGQGSAIFWANDVNNALALRHKREKGGRAKLGNVAVKRGDLLFADGVGDAVVA